MTDASQRPSQTVTDIESKIRNQRCVMANDVILNYNRQVDGNRITIWLDSNINMTEDCLETQRYLHRVFTNLITFNTVDACYDYIFSITTEKIFLIVSGRLGAIIVPRIHGLDHVESIYIFCADKLTHEQWAKTHFKIRGVFDDRSLLLAKLCFSVTSRFHDPSPISIFHTTDSKEKSIRNLNKQSTTFMWFQLLLEILLRMPSTPQSQSEMLNLCRSIYQNDPTELQKIDEFEEHYASRQAVFWYTRDCFVYRLLNKLLRTENIDMIYTFRYFIRDLHQALQILHSEYAQWLQRNGGTLTVYRGQRMSMVELEELKQNINNFIAMNTFLSTTLQRHIAIIYAGSCTECPYVESVLFEIGVNITDRMDTKPFAMIAQHSDFFNEEEILFSMGAIFQIESVSQYTDGMWIVKLHLTSIENQHLASLNEYMKKNIGEETALLDLGKFLMTMGEDDKAVKYFELFLKEIPSNHRDMSYVYTQIGHIYLKKDDYETALLNYEIAFEHQEWSQPPNYLSFPQAYENIGFVNEKMGLCHIALSYYQKQLECYQNNSESNEELIMKVEQKLNTLYNESDYFEEKELEYSNQRLETYLKFRPANHPDLIKIYSNVALACNHSNDYENAITNYEKALEICLLSLPPTHEQTRITYYNIACCQYQNGQYEKSLRNFDMALGLELKCQSPKLLFIAKIYNSCGSVLFQKNDLENAAKMYEKSIKICCKNSTPKSEYYQNLGHVLLESDENEKAVEALETALQIELNSSLPRASIVTRLYIDIGHGYFALKNYVNAITNYQKAFQAAEHSSQLKIEPSWIEKVIVHGTFEDNDRSRTHNTADHMLTALQYKNTVEMYFNYRKEIDIVVELISAIHLPTDDLLMTEDYDDYAEVCLRNNDFKQALEIYHKVVDVELCKPSKNLKKLQTNYTSIASIYYQIESYQLATTYFEKALELALGTSPIDKTTISNLYKNLGEAKYSNQNYGEALCAYNEALTMMATRELPWQFDIATMHNSIGMVYYQLGEYTESIANFERAIDIAIPHLSKANALFDSFLMNLEIVYMQRDDLEKAIQCRSKFLALKLEFSPMNLLPLANDYSRLGYLNFRNRSYQASIENFKKSIEIQLTLSPAITESILESYLGLANVYREDRNYVEALVYYERALKTEQEQESPRTVLLASIYNYIGNVQYEQNNYELSISNYTKAIAIFGDDANNGACYYDNLAEAYRMANRYDTAIENYSKALEIKLKSTPLEPIKIAKSYAYLGKIYSQKENYQISIENYQKAIETSLPIIPLPTSLMSWYHDLTEVYIRSKDFQNAQCSCESVLQTEMLFSNLDPLALAEVYDELSLINYLKGDYETALAWDRKVLESRLVHLLPNDSLIGVSFNNTGKTLFRLGIYDESFFNFRKAIDIFSESIPTSNADIINTYKNMGELFERTHQFNNASESYEKSMELFLKQDPLNTDFYLFYIELYPYKVRFHLLKSLIMMQNLIKMRLE